MREDIRRDVMRTVPTAAAAVFGLASLVLAAQAGEITVMSTVAVKDAYLELVPRFERATKFLASPEAAPAIRKMGSEPGRRPLMGA
jgi:hypothetical protein